MRDEKKKPLALLEATQAYVDYLEKEIADYEAELAKHQWIKCSERLPEDSGMYLTFNRVYNCVPTGISINLFRRDVHFGTAHVTHWMPIPEPPKEEEK